ncbi:MAG: hypothetical protein DRI34_03700 [Deltaproteobacteria bacterium]|nr:MAG: hypothetical protein DRI34_03700 [Deltaproteobacteria bacterium]
MNTLVLLLLLWSSGAPGATGPAAAGNGVSVALWRLRPLGLDAATAERLEQLLRAELGRLPGLRLQAAEQTSTYLSGPRWDRLRQCPGDTTCLCGVARAAKVDKLITGVIGALGDDYTLDLKLVDAAGCREERRINEALSGQQDLLIGAMRAALYKLVAPRLYVGSIMLEVAASGAEVLVDGRPVGRTPLAGPITSLRPGGHKITIKKEGTSSFEEVVPVRFQQVTRVKVDLVRSTLVGISYEREGGRQQAPAGSTELTRPAPAPPSPALKIAAWTSLGLAVAGATAGALCGWRAQVAEDEIEQAVQEGTLGPAHQAVIDRGRRWALGTNISWGVAAGAAVLGTVMFILDSLSRSEATSPAVSLGGPAGVVGLGFAF